MDPFTLLNADVESAAAKVLELAWELEEAQERLRRRVDVLSAVIDAYESRVLYAPIESKALVATYGRK